MFFLRVSRKEYRAVNILFQPWKTLREIKSYYTWDSWPVKNRRWKICNALRHQVCKCVT
jgi:hypothetical protein